MAGDTTSDRPPKPQPDAAVQALDRLVGRWTPSGSTARSAIPATMSWQVLRWTKLRRSGDV